MAATARSEYRRLLRAGVSPDVAAVLADYAVRARRNARRPSQARAGRGRGAGVERGALRRLQGQG